MFTPGARVLILSQGEDEASEELDRVKFTHDNLPDWMHMEIGRSNQSDLEFPAVLRDGRRGNDSLIRALPSTTKAGSGYSATLVIRDELAKHRYASENYAAVAPTVEEGNAQLIEFSTAWGDDDYMQPRWQLAKEGKLPGFAHIFLGYDERPGREEHWREQTRLNYEGLPGEFEENYPRNDVEAFRLTAVRVVFDPADLTRLRDQVRPPIETFSMLNGRALGEGGYFRIWRRPVLGNRYSIGIDPGWGLGQDGSCAQVVDIGNGLHVASLYSMHWDLDTFATLCLYVADMFHQALLVPEVNAVGIGLVEKLLAAYPSRKHQLYFRDWEEAAVRGDPPKLPGWHTDNRTKRIAVTDAQTAAHDGSLTTWDIDTIGEMGTFVHEGVRMEAREGRHDDRVMALLLGWQGRRHPGVRLPQTAPIVVSYVS